MTMRAFSSVLGFGALFLSTVFGTAFGASSNSSDDTVSTVFQLQDNGTWFENLVVRQNGHLLATRIDVPEVWTIDPNADNVGSRLSTIPNTTSLLGITEIEQDVYAVVAGNFSIEKVQSTPGSYSIWTVDLSGAKANTPKTRLLTAIPEAEFLDGLIPFGKDLCLVSDAQKGAIWRVNVRTGEYSQALSHPNMAPADGQPVPVGVNGIKIRDNYVYYSTTTRQILARVPVDENASAAGDVEDVVSGLIVDDFWLLEDGTAYLATNTLNSVVKVLPGGGVMVVAGNAFRTDVAGSTAVAMSWDQEVLYVTTAGAQVQPVMCQTIEPAKIVAVRL